MVEELYDGLHGIYRDRYFHGLRTSSRRAWCFLNLSDDKHFISELPT